MDELPAESKVRIEVKNLNVENMTAKEMIEIDHRYEMNFFLRCTVDLQIDITKASVWF